MHAFADLILIVHFAFVLFVVGGLPAIWLGAACGWRWIRNFKFRAAHLAVISFVALEALLGIACPLTVWEDVLRGALTETSFVARWLRRLLYYSFPEWVFACAYLLFALAVAITWWRVPPRRSHTQAAK
jgi:polyferredoxin